MRKISCLLLVLAGCARPEADPVRVAERFHTLRLAADEPGIHALLTGADRAAVPVAAFPAALPPAVELELFGWGESRLDSVSLLSVDRDTAAVVLHVWPGPPDTLRLVAEHHPLRVWRFERDRVRWRVSLALAERAVLDSLAASMRANAGAAHPQAVDHAKAYLQATERYPGLARPADLDAAAATLRKAAVARALRVELAAAESFTGTRFVSGRVDNPTGTRIATLRLIVQDAAGGEERVELWDIAAGGSAGVWQLTRLGNGPLKHRLERIQLF